MNFDQESTVFFLSHDLRTPNMCCISHIYIKNETKKKNKKRMMNGEMNDRTIQWIKIVRLLHQRSINENESHDMNGKQRLVSREERSEIKEKKKNIRSQTDIKLYVIYGSWKLRRFSSFHFIFFIIKFLWRTLLNFVRLWTHQDDCYVIHVHRMCFWDLFPFFFPFHCRRN